MGELESREGERIRQASHRNHEARCRISAPSILEYIRDLTIHSTLRQLMLPNFIRNIPFFEKKESYIPLQLLTHQVG